jgi:hypothetical protein
VGNPFENQIGTMSATATPARYHAARPPWALDVPPEP